VVKGGKVDRKKKGEARLPPASARVRRKGPAAYATIQHIYKTAEY